MRPFHRRSNPVAQLDQCAVVLIERFDGGIQAAEHLAVEFHLLADVPVQHSSHQPLPGLHHGVGQAAGARIHRPDSGHFAERRVARVHQPHKVGHGDARRARGSLRALRTHALTDLPQNRDQLSAFHGVPSGPCSSLL